MPPRTFTVSIPHIETARLLLREYRPSDFDAYAENHADPVANAHLAGVLDRRTSWRLFLANAGSWVLYGLGWWSAEVRSTGEVAGIVGVFVRDGRPGLEAGWVIYPRFYRQGFATEGARAAIAFAFENHPAPRVSALIAPGNEASLSVARRLGMRREGSITFYDRPSEEYVLDRPAPPAGG